MSTSRSPVILVATLLSLLSLLASACSRAPDADGARLASAGLFPSADTADYPAWTRNAVIYEVNVRQFTPEGTLAALETHLPRLRDLGVDILWLMPVQPIGVKNRKGLLGSYYSISDYTAINPEHGTEADFRRFVDAAHGLGMKVILDWVANHTAFDHPWIDTHADYHVRLPDGSVSNARDNEGKETDWTDVAELDYDNPRMRQDMIREMRWWVEEMGIDGFRCDVAGGVPMDFWVEARDSLKAVRPDLFLLAEAEDPAIHAAFDMTYGWRLHHLLNDIAQGKANTASLDAYFAREDSLFGRGAFRMYFTSNHDENSWNGTEFERMGANHAPAFVLSATAQNSMPLLYTGQEASLSKRLRFFEKDTVDWNGPSLVSFYKALFELKRQQPALANGPWGAPQVALETTGGDRVYAFTRTTGDNTVLVALNFGDRPSKADYAGLSPEGSFVDWFTKEAVVLGATGTLEIPANGYRILVASSASATTEGSFASGTPGFLYAWATAVDIAAPAARPAGGASSPPPRPRGVVLAVVDIREGSPTRGTVVDVVLAADTAARNSHHTEHALAADGYLFANDFGAGRTYRFDLRTPGRASLLGHFTGAGPLGFPHSYVQLPGGNILATFQRRGAAPPGGLAELRRDGSLVRWKSAAMPGVDSATILPYSLEVIPSLDRVVSTSTSMTTDDGVHVQVWRLSDLTPLHTIALPSAPAHGGHEGAAAAATASAHVASHHLLPGEPRLLADGRTVMFGTFTCGLYRLTGVEGTSPRVEYLMSFPGADCAVPVRVGRWWVQTVPAVRALVVLDVSNSARPQEVARLPFPAPVSPHWLSADAGGTRLVMSSGDLADPRLYLVRLDPTTGAISPDPLIPSIDLSRVTVPGLGVVRLIAHGTVFGPGA